MTPPAISTLGELRRAGHASRSVKTEIRQNLLARLAAGEPSFPGIVGFDDTVLPEVERALLAGHDMVLLGERGQGKTRMIRTAVGLLDEWVPVVAGCEINDDPLAPVCRGCVAVTAERGDATPVSWLHRSRRYGEKLATPDTSVGDLIGDVDPIKVAEGRTLGDPETVHYGLIPRTNRGIFSVNELPDLAERIQVALLNVLEERDIQIRGYTLRLPLDLILIASANPEDYTNRGRIITPLKDRFGAEVRTHYPLDLTDEIALVRQEARVIWDADATHPAPVVPEHLIETVAASAVRRAAVVGEPLAVARTADLPSVVPASRGKVEFEDADEDRELELLAHLLRRATAETFRARLAGVDLAPLQRKFDEGGTVETGDLVPAAELLRQVGPFAGLSAVVARLESGGGAEDPGMAAAAVEFALEGLYLNRRLSKDDSHGGRSVYGGS